MRSEFPGSFSMQYELLRLGFYWLGIRTASGTSGCQCDACRTTCSVADDRLGVARVVTSRLGLAPSQPAFDVRGHRDLWMQDPIRIVALKKTQNRVAC